MADINATVLAIESMLSPLYSILNTFRILIGGVFGLYLIGLVINWYKTRKLSKAIVEMKADLAYIRKKLDARKRKRR